MSGARAGLIARSPRERSGARPARRRAVRSSCSRRIRWLTCRRRRRRRRARGLAWASGSLACAQRARIHLLARMRETRIRVLADFAAVVLIAGALACIVAVVRGAGAPLVRRDLGGRAGDGRDRLRRRLGDLARAADRLRDRRARAGRAPALRVVAVAVGARRDHGGHGERCRRGRAGRLRPCQPRGRRRGGRARAEPLAAQHDDRAARRRGARASAAARTRRRSRRRCAARRPGGRRPGSVPARPSAGPCSPRSSPSRRRR